MGRFSSEFSALSEKGFMRKMGGAPEERHLKIRRRIRAESGDLLRGTRAAFLRESRLKRFANGNIPRGTPTAGSGTLCLANGFLDSEELRERKLKNAGSRRFQLIDGKVRARGLYFEGGLFPENSAGGSKGKRGCAANPNRPEDCDRSPRPGERAGLDLAGGRQISKLRYVFGGRSREFRGEPLTRYGGVF